MPDENTSSEERSELRKELDTIAQGLAGPSDSTDPKAQADHAITLIDGFAQMGPDAKKVREAIIAALGEFEVASQENREQALEVFTESMVALQSEASDLVLKSLKRMRDDVAKKSRVLGTKSERGQMGRLMAESLDILIGALELMRQAAADGDKELHDQAADLLRQGQEILQGHL